jgi:hypothetical protein
MSVKPAAAHPETPAVHARPHWRTPFPALIEILLSQPCEEDKPFLFWTVFHASEQSSQQKGDES